MRYVKRAVLFVLLILAVLVASSTGLFDHSHGKWTGRALLDDFEEIPVPRDGDPRGGSLFRYKKTTGPGVLILHEVNGLTHETLQLAEDIGDEGYSVFVPLLFGEPEPEDKSGGILSVCWSRDFNCLSTDTTSPIVPWLRGLLPEVKARSQGGGVAVIGMCLTGSFPLAFLDDPEVKVAVLSQPTLPLPLFAGQRRSLGLHPDLIQAARKRHETSPVRIVAMRYRNDSKAAPERFLALKEQFGVDGIEYEESLYQGSKKNPHALLTGSRLDEAYRAVLAALNEELKPR